MRIRRPALLAAGLLAMVPARAAAQYYLLSENKIQYRRLDWQVLHGTRVDVYYYPEEAELAPVALAYAEESYDVLAPKFGHTVSTRVPLIVYASHTDFEQTNILPFTPPEGLLGVTDFLKRRVTLPFRGNMAEFRHTLRHEMVHVFQISYLNDRYERSPRAGQISIPLWWTEGLAELWSGGEDARDEMILRDLVLGGRLPALQDLGYAAGGIVYPLGGRIHRWLADTYGDWRVASFYRDLWRYESFRAGNRRDLWQAAADAQRGVPGRHAAAVLSRGRGPEFPARERPAAGVGGDQTDLFPKRQHRAETWSMPPRATASSPSSSGPSTRARRRRWSPPGGAPVSRTCMPSTPGSMPHDPTCCSSAPASRIGMR